MRRGCPDARCDVEMRKEQESERRRAPRLGVLLASPLGDCHEVLERGLDLGPPTGLETAVGVDEEAGGREASSVAIECRSEQSRLTASDWAGQP